MNKLGHPGTNGLLAALSTDQRRHFLDSATMVSLRPNKVLSEAEQLIQHVYFPTTSVLSLLSVMTNRVAVETAVVGYEGMAPLAAFHHVESAAEQVIVQVPGDALRLTRQDFHRVLAAVPAMHPIMHRYSQALFTFAAQSSACNRQHSVVQRCARWLLTSHDRCPGDDFYLTHLFLSQMLGVRRSSVTIAAEILRTSGAIRYSRGRVHIVDRAKLEDKSCECYAIVRSTYDRLLMGRDTPSPLDAVRFSAGDESLTRGHNEDLARPSPSYGLMVPAEESFTQFSIRLQDAKRRSQDLRALTELTEREVELNDVLRLSEELVAAFEQLEVADEEMRVQMAALDEMRVAMQAQEQLWRTRFDGLPDAFIETDADELIADMNRAAEDLLGQSRARFIGKPLTSLFVDTDRRGLRATISQLRGGEAYAHWSGTLVSTGRDRPDVDVAVAAASSVAPHAASVASATSRYVGARWLLRARKKSQRTTR